MSKITVLANTVSGQSSLPRRSSFPVNSQSGGALEAASLRLV